LRREEQVEGLKKWERRGQWEEGKLGGSIVDKKSKQDVLDGCIRCDKGTEQGTMGFFVAAFVREGEDNNIAREGRVEPDEMDVEEARKPAAPTAEQDGDDEEEWDGFSDDEGAAELKAKAEEVVEKQEQEQAKESKKQKTKRRKTGKQ
jgi:putative methyltransferase